MDANNETLIEETWWEVTTSTGLTLRLPAPFGLINTEAKLEPGLFLRSSSKITGMDYGVKAGEIVYVQQFQRKQDPDRLAKARMKLEELTSSGSSSRRSQEA
jgi:hypothetical protein